VCCITLNRVEFFFLNFRLFKTIFKRLSAKTQRLASYCAEQFVF
jgi:hypothetical protein